MSAKAAALVLATAAAVVLAGCTWARPVVRQETLLSRLGQTSAAGKLLLPKRCRMRMLILARPPKDPALNEALWRVADEQVVSPETRGLLEANGLRLGRITGALPGEVQALIDAPPPHKVDPRIVSNSSGEPSLAALAPVRSQATVFINIDGRVTGRDYQDAQGMLRLTATLDGMRGARLRLVPEVHHGAIRNGVAAAPTTNPFGAQQFTYRSGQEEDTFRELAAELDVAPHHAVVVGCYPRNDHSLGSFLFTEPEPNSDRVLQKVLLIWVEPGPATENDDTIPAPEIADPISAGAAGPKAPEPPALPPAQGAPLDTSGDAKTPTDADAQTAARSRPKRLRMFAN